MAMVEQESAAWVRTRVYAGRTSLYDRAVERSSEPVTEGPYR